MHALTGTALPHVAVLALVVVVLQGLWGLGGAASGQSGSLSGSGSKYLEATENRKWDGQWFTGSGTVLLGITGERHMSF